MDKFLTYCGLQKQREHLKNLSYDRKYLTGIRKKYFVNTSEYFELSIWNVSFIHTQRQEMCFALHIGLQFV